MLSTFEAVFGEDLTATVEAPGDGGDTCGTASAGTLVVRVNNVFNVRATAPASGKWIPHSGQATSIDLKMNVIAVVSAASESWMPRRYGSLGDDPNPDSAATAFGRSGGGTAYLASATTNYRTTGAKTDTLNSSAVTDCNDRIANDASVWTIAIQQTSEATGAGSHNTNFSEYIDGTAANRPQIVVTWKAIKDPIPCGGMCPGRRL